MFRLFNRLSPEAKVAGQVLITAGLALNLAYQLYRQYEAEAKEPRVSESSSPVLDNQTPIRGVGESASPIHRMQFG